jgi:hypothetical protein
MKCLLPWVQQSAQDAHLCSGHQTPVVPSLIVLEEGEAPQYPQLTISGAQQRNMSRKRTPFDLVERQQRWYIFYRQMLCLFLLALPRAGRFEQSGDGVKAYATC